MKVLKSYVRDRWVEPTGELATLVNPATEEPLARTGTGGIDFAAVVDHARRVGGPALRALGYGRRGELLRDLSRALHEHRDELLDLGTANVGATRSDAKFDVDGATGTLAAYGEIGIGLGDRAFLAVGEGLGLGRGAKIWGQHVLVPRAGVAIHVNAFNFPAWGMMEKLAVAILAGVPVVTKPATSTALLAHRMMEILAASGLFPEGSVQLLAGGLGDLFDHLGPQDHVAFTGSSDTARKIRTHPALLDGSVRINVEADSLNCAVLGPDVEPGSESWHLFVRDVVKEMTQKAGQKCTAIRRVYVPTTRIADVREALGEALAEIVVGDPAHKDVGMGPLTTAAQLRSVRDGVDRLLGNARLAWGERDGLQPVGAPEGKGFFHPPLLLESTEPRPDDAVHTLEVFGPVATLVPWTGGIDAVTPLVAAGSGGLVTSIYSDDVGFTRDAILALGPLHGRLVLGSEKIAGQTIPPGAVLPHLVHGGPGRAGGGEELGGRRGLAFYHQRTALQGARAVIERLVEKG